MTPTDATKALEAVLAGKWYVVSASGLVTMCDSKSDADFVANESNMSWPPGAPHTVTQLAQPAGDAAADAGRFFSYSDGCFDEHSSLAAARDDAEKLLQGYADQAPDGWDEEVMNIAYGVILGGVVETERRPVTPEDHLDSLIGEYVDYQLREFTTAPAAASDARDAARYRVMMSAQNLNNPATLNAVVSGLVDKGGSWTSKETWDAAIDSAITPQEQPK